MIETIDVMEQFIIRVLTERTSSNAELQAAVKIAELWFSFYITRDEY